MSRSQDEIFFDTFMVVLGALVLATIIAIAIANRIADATIGESLKQNETILAAIEERVAPIGSVLVAGQAAKPSNAMLAAMNPEPASVAPEVASGPRSGEQVYNMACVACHANDLLGAPVIGDAQGWAPRLAQGLETLVEHAINGYTGENGLMPARGGNPSLSDDDVRAGVEYMIKDAQ